MTFTEQQCSPTKPLEMLRARVSTPGLEFLSDGYAENRAYRLGRVLCVG